MSTRKPNIVLILADDLGIGDVACTSGGLGRIPTPHMDRAAAAGRIFTDAHSNSAVCTPTRYGLLTGRYCWRTRLKSGVLYGAGGPLIPDDRATMASVLRDAGYATCCVGKWHLGLGWQQVDGCGPDDRGDFDMARLDFAKPLTSGPHTLGFDHSFIIPASLDMAPYVYIENGRVTQVPDREVAASPRPACWRAGPAAPGFEHETCLREFTRYAESFIEQQATRHPDQPFLLYFPTPSPHTPHVPRPPFQGKSGLGVYGDFVMEHDWSIGVLLDALDRHGIADDTLVVITSDNGAHSGPLGLDELGHRCNGQYRGQKSDAWDGGHRVPFIARGPGIPAGTHCDETICLTDLLATFAGLAGANLPAACSEDGADVWGLFTGAANGPQRPPVIHHSIDGSFAIRRGAWKLVACPGSGGWTMPNAKVPESTPRRQLYRMDSDAVEATNLEAVHPGIADELEALIAEARTGERTVA